MLTLFVCFRVKKGCVGERSGFHIGFVEPGKKGTLKLPFTPLDNLSNQREESSMMAHRRLTFDPYGKENTLLVGNKLPRSNGSNIKERISLWEGKEPTHTPLTLVSPSMSPCAKRTESFTKSPSKGTDEQNTAESSRRSPHAEKQDLGKENVAKPSDSRPRSPVEPMKQQQVMFKSSKPSEKLKGEDCSKTAPKGTQDHANENLEKSGDLRPCSPSSEVKQQVKKSSDRRTAEQSTQETRAMFTLFKKLEQAMGGNQGKTPPELGNYFSPPSKDKQGEAKKKESEGTKAQDDENREATQQLKNVYTEPGELPINPVPKPRRTFQHPTTVPLGKSQRHGRARRNLPPLPSVSPQPPSQPSPNVHRRSRSERARDNIKRYEGYLLRKHTSVLG